MRYPPIDNLNAYEENVYFVSMRRFADASIPVLCLCYLEAILMGGELSVFWSWFPISSVGIRLSLLIINALTILTIRRRWMHLGYTAPLSSATLHQKVMLGGCYVLTAVEFHATYLMWAPESANLRHGSETDAYGRQRINERPWFILMNFLLLAIIQLCCHVSQDYDRLRLPAITQIQTDSLGEPSSEPTPLLKLKADLPRCIEAAYTRCFLALALAPVLYTLLLRPEQSIAFGSSTAPAGMFWAILSFAFQYTLIFRAFTSGMLLVMLWEVTGASFNAYMGQGPNWEMKRNVLSSSEPDPNETLLLGINSTEPLAKMLAFWELTLISQSDPKRRRAIFNEFDRKGGSTWSKICRRMLDEVQAINTRIAAELQPPSPPPPQVAAIPVASPTPNNPEPLPRLAPPLKDCQIFVVPPKPSSRPEKAQTTVDGVGKTYGQVSSVLPSTWLDDGSCIEYKVLSTLTGVIKKGVDQILTPELQRRYKVDWILSEAQSRVITQDEIDARVRVFQSYPSLRRRSAAVVLGTPYGEPKLIIDAIDTLTRLSSGSLSEDHFGKVALDVPTIIRVFVQTINNIERLEASMKPRVYEVEASTVDYEEEAFREPNLIKGVLEIALNRLLLDFEGHADALGLGRREVELAKDAAHFRSNTTAVDSAHVDRTKVQ